MATMNMVEQLEEQPPVEKPRIDNPEEQGEIANSNEAGLPKSVEMMEHKESRTSTTIMDLSGNIWINLIGCLAFFFTFMWFFTKSDTHIQFQMIAVMGLALVIIAVSLWDKFYGKLYRPLRVGIFSCMGLSVTETSTPTMTMDLARRHLKLPAELDREIFLFLKSAAQRKFIWGLNWDFYAMFRYRLLTKSKRVRNPHGNRCNGANTTATVAQNGLNVSITNTNHRFLNVYAVQTFPISGPQCRADHFPGTILYYYEVKTNGSCVGLSGGIADNLGIGRYPNSYGILILGSHCSGCWLAGERHRFELPLPVGAVRPEMRQFGNVYGCGLVLDPDNNLTIFFTLNGQFFGRKFPVRPSVDRLFPAVSILNGSFFEANFGDDPAKPFEYDIQNCPGLELACI